MEKSISYDSLKDRSSSLFSSLEDYSFDSEKKLSPKFSSEEDERTSQTKDDLACILSAEEEIKNIFSKPIKPKRVSVVSLKF